MTRFIAEAKTAHFIQVTPRVVRDVKGAANALVYIRLVWRCTDVHVGHSIADGEGRVWWIADAGRMSEETGLTVEQVRYALSKLMADGWVDQWPQGRGRVNWHAPSGSRKIPTPSEPPSENPDTLSENPETLPSEIPESLLYIENDASGGQDIEKSAGVDQSVLAFEEAWKHWPRKESKKKAVDKFLRIASQAKRLEVASAIVLHGDAHRLHSGDFTPHLITWLNGERWNDPLPGPRNQQSRQQMKEREQLDLLERLRVEERGDRRGAIEA